MRISAGPCATSPAPESTRIGAFAVEPNELAAGTDAAIFRLFVTLSMYQALRDVVIMRQQHSLPRTSMRIVADVATVKRSIARHTCPRLRSVEAFEQGCDVMKNVFTHAVLSMRSLSRRTRRSPTRKPAGN
jgi:malate synthase